MQDNNVLRISSYIEDSIVDGPGLRLAIYTQGCTHNCYRCHNPHTHDVGGGREIKVNDLLEVVFSNPLCSGVTFSGGEPLLQPCPLAEIACKCKNKGLSVWLYTGFTWEEILVMMQKNTCVKELIENCDVVVDGRFELAKRDLRLHFRGSSNQRLVDVKKSLDNNKIIEFNLE